MVTSALDPTPSFPGVCCSEAWARWLSIVIKPFVKEDATSLPFTLTWERSFYRRQNKKFVGSDQKGICQCLTRPVSHNLPSCAVRILSSVMCEKPTGPLPTPLQNRISNIFEVSANWEMAGSHTSLWHLLQQMPVNKWHDSLGLSDKDGPVTGSPGEGIFGGDLNTHFNWW